ncbi:MAG: sugar ABC transporter permease [Ruminiclostridium sp.]|nr:sugar ABC transporter permease [Ruminiclostridium sp.]
MNAGISINNTVSRRIGLITYIKKYWFIYLLVLPGFVHTIIFKYFPMYGILAAFKDLKISRGVLGSPWVGFKHFTEIFWDPYFYKVLWNTVIINIYNIGFSFAFIILLALMLNEIRVGFLKRIFQTFVYLPNFLSWVVFSGLVITFLSPSDGPLNRIIASLGQEPIYFLVKTQYFRAILVISGIVKGAGFATIIYLAAIAGINPELYECAYLDGANRLKMMWYITLPRIKPTIAVLLILSFSGIFSSSSNFEQIFLLYNPAVWDTGDVISTYLYRSGLLNGQYEMATALGLIFNLAGLFMILVTNKLVEKMNVMGIL